MRRSAPVVRCRLVVPAVAAALLVALVSPSLAQRGRGNQRRKSKESTAVPAEARETLEYLVGKLGDSPTNVSRVLGQYNQIELGGKWNIFARRMLHEGLLEALRKIDDAAIVRAANAIESGGRTRLAMRILMMKVLIGDRFPAPRSTRAARLVKLARGRDFRLSVWAMRLLGDSRWAESVDALIDILKREEIESNTEGILWNIASAELYRLLGKQAAQGTTAEAIRENWERMGKKLPGEVDYEPLGGGGRTISFFGDLISPRAAFAIDISSSMLQKTVLVYGGERGRTTTKKKDTARPTGPQRPKVEIVKEELARALSRLRPHYKFTVIAYDATPAPWRAGGGERLFSASSRTQQAAIQYARALEAGRGTNIHDTMAMALAIPEVETVYLLSDGVPSRGGSKEEVEKRVAAMNYLRGIRVVTYGFAAEKQGSYDEAFMKRLAQRSWGWYRCLNRR